MASAAPPLNPARIASVLVAHRARWIAPAVVCCLLAGVYGLLFRTKLYDASQGLTIRDEVVGTIRGGRFDTADSMKAAQETVMELVRSSAVVSAALLQVGPEWGGDPPQGWPSQALVEQTQSYISLKPPNGNEFGKTEVFYLHVRQKSRERAEALAAAVSDQLEAQLRELRRKRAGSVIEELSRTVELAREELGKSAGELGQLEATVGSDLVDLRLLSSPSGESNLRGTLIAARNDLRAAELVKRSKLELMQLLKNAQNDPSTIVATPSELLESQPALRKLKDGLVDSQLLTSQLMSQMSAEHPRVIQSLQAQEEIKQRLHNELANSLRGLQAEIDTTQARLTSLEKNVAEIDGRLGRLAELRVRYSNLASEVDRRNEILKKSSETMADARASAAASESASVLTRLDQPLAGRYPLGPGTMTLAFGGLVIGLVAGLGIVFLTVPLADAPAEPVALRTAGRTQGANRPAPRRQPSKSGQAATSTAALGTEISAAPAAPTAATSAAAPAAGKPPTKPRRPAPSHARPRPASVRPQVIDGDALVRGATAAADPQHDSPKPQITRRASASPASATPEDNAATAALPAAPLAQFDLPPAAPGESPVGEAQLPHGEPAPAATASSHSATAASPSDGSLDPAAILASLSGGSAWGQTNWGGGQPLTGFGLTDADITPAGFPPPSQAS